MSAHDNKIECDDESTTAITPLTSSSTISTPSSSTSGDASFRILVSIRVRPLNERELNGGATKACVVNLTDNIIEMLPPFNTSQNSRAKVDHVFDDDVDNASIYQATSKQIVLDTLNGINGTIFA